MRKANRMKYSGVVLAAAAWWGSTLGADVAADAAKARAAREARLERGQFEVLLKKHDVNENGKIDAEERKAFNRDRALLHREKELAEMERLRLNPPVRNGHRALYWWERELLPQYDRNKDGWLDEEERMAMPKDLLAAGKEARARRLKAEAEAEAAKPAENPAN